MNTHTVHRHKALVPTQSDTTLCVYCVKKPESCPYANRGIMRCSRYALQHLNSSPRAKSRAPRTSETEAVANAATRFECASNSLSRVHVLSPLRFHILTHPASHPVQTLRPPSSTMQHLPWLCWFWISDRLSTHHTGCGCGSECTAS